MQNPTERVLAYELSTIMDKEELDTISGGSGGSWSSTLKGGGSGGSGQGGEVHIDIRWDM
ncbi:MAG: hypothetical protein H0U75_11135 [Legionella sp.]|nr:hypothetical protein [Legionella sp.]